MNQAGCEDSSGHAAHFFHSAGWFCTRPLDGRTGNRAVRLIFIEERFAPLNKKVLP
jgi:hypothetical protein